MTLIAFDTGLRQDGHEGVIALARITHSGMAHFAGTGPVGSTCRECRYWGATGRYKAGIPGTPARPKPASCGRYRQMMARTGDRIPHDALACKFFEESQSPQALDRPSREPRE